jgi:hypothetical protein
MTLSRKTEFCVACAKDFFFYADDRSVHARSSSLFFSRITKLASLARVGWLTQHVSLYQIKAMASTAMDDSRMIPDLYVMVINSLKRASLVSPPVGATSYFNPELKEEIHDGVNNRGK